MIIILLLWLRTQMLDGPLDQMALHKVDSWSSLQTPSCCKAENRVAETQAAADGDDEAVYIRLCLKEVLFGQLDLRNWQSEARQIPAALHLLVLV